jgi:hypothetical protein
MTLKGKVSIPGAKAVFVNLQGNATRQIAWGCAHYNIGGPIFNGGESGGWHKDHFDLAVFADVAEDGSFEVQMPARMSKLERSLCRNVMSGIFFTIVGADHTPLGAVYLSAGSASDPQDLVLVARDNLAEGEIERANLSFKSNLTVEIRK